MIFSDRSDDPLTTVVLAVAIGAIARRGATAVTAVIVVIVVPYLLAMSVLPGSAAQRLLRITPAAAFAVQQSAVRYLQVDNITAIPRRTSVLAAKAATFTGVVVTAATVAVLASLLAGRLIQSGDGYPPPGVGDGAVLRAAAGSVRYLALVALLSLGIATAVRDPATAIGIVLGLLYVLPIITQAVSDPDWRRHLQQIGPMSAGLAIQATTHLSSLPISPLGGARRTRRPGRGGPARRLATAPAARRVTIVTATSAVLVTPGTSAVGPITRATRAGRWEPGGT